MKFGGRIAWPLLCWVITLALSVPVLSILWSITEDSEGVWQHLAETVLGGYIRNTLILSVGVGIGTMVIGVSSAWLVTSCSFPFVRILRWALLLPLAIPTYLSAYALTDLLQFSGPVQSWMREVTGWTRHDYWFPEVRSLPGAIGILTLGLYPYVYLAARTGFASQSASVIDASRTLGVGPWGRFFLTVTVPGVGVCIGIRRRRRKWAGSAASRCGSGICLNARQDSASRRGE
jgi:iron(III) transport system permease protein